jgi:hypothetical protein
MRLAARILLPGTGWVAFKELMDLVSLMMDLFGKMSRVGFLEIEMGLVAGKSSPLQKNK